MFIEIIFVRSVREYTIESVHDIIGTEMRRKKIYTILHVKLQLFHIFFSPWELCQT